MKTNRIALACAVALVAAFAALTPSSLNAQSILNLAVEPFQVTVPVNLFNCFCYTPVAIPAGKRLVVQEVSMSGAATSLNGAVQPINILNAQLNGQTAVLQYYAPPQDAQITGQFYANWQTTLYADTLSVGPAYSGFEPNFDSFNVVIIGYLIPAPASATPSVTVK